MTIFVVTAIRNPDAIGAEVERAFPNAHLPVVTGTWLVSANLTAIEVSNKLGVTGAAGPAVGTALIVAISSYYGRAPSEIWDWIKTKWEDGPNG
jgi:hypothetical protein